jgi:hypothetical protein
MKESGHVIIEITSRHLLRRTEEIHNESQFSISRIQVLRLQPPCSVKINQDLVKINYKHSILYLFS